MSPISWKVAALALAFLGVAVGGLAAVSSAPASNGMSETIVAPHSLNVHSHGNFVTAILKNAADLPEDLDASDLTATASVSIGGADVALDATVRAFDGPNHTVVVTIDRQAINTAMSDALAAGGSVDDPLTLTVTVSGGGESVTRSGDLDWFAKP